MSLLRLPLVVALFLAGCSGLLTGTQVFEFDVVRDGQPNAPGQPVDLGVVGSFAETRIALGDNDTFEKHRGSIESIDRAGFEGSVDNPGSATTFSIYFSPEAGLADPASSATPLILGLPVPAGTTAISYRDTEAALRNMGAFAPVVAGADFSLYLVADGPSGVQIRELALVVAFTVGL